ncbi:phytanoyl-CoA dioxygenase family protein [Apiospora saccharicola]|uniref:Phytanoyl-CoA dioxygenase family protein n=1 Tax=Apiospora saccharicola TaxID=335842 RepID=A0ABR1TJK9_9PEZI
MPPLPQVTQIELTLDELTSKRMGSRHLQAAVEALHRDGMVVLSNAVDPAHLDKLNERMVPEAQELYSRPTTHRNFGNETGNIQQEPVLEDGYIFADVLANPWATERQHGLPSHGPPAAPYRYPLRFPPVPFGYCVNINLVATSPENGATEVWLGSHTDTTKHVLETDPATGYEQIRADLQEQRRMISPPIQPSLPQGALIIRDFRLWHAGMPNRTGEPRVMLVSVQFPRWYRSDLKMKLPASIKDTVQWGDVVSVSPLARWLAGWLAGWLDRVLPPAHLISRRAFEISRLVLIVTGRGRFRVPSGCPTDTTI